MAVTIARPISVAMKIAIPTSFATVVQYTEKYNGAPIVNGTTETFRLRK